MKMAYKDRGFFAADTDFIEVPLTGMASKEYAKELASQKIGRASCRERVYQVV